MELAGFLARMLVPPGRSLGSQLRLQSLPNFFWGFSPAPALYSPKEYIFPLEPSSRHSLKKSNHIYHVRVLTFAKASNHKKKFPRFCTLYFVGATPSSRCCSAPNLHSWFCQNMLCMYSILRSQHCKIQGRPP